MRDVAKSRDKRGKRQEAKSHFNPLKLINCPIPQILEQIIKIFILIAGSLNLIFKLFSIILLAKEIMEASRMAAKTEPCAKENQL